MVTLSHRPHLCEQALMVRESFGLSRMDQEERKLPGFRLQQWFFFVVATFYLYFRCERAVSGGRGCVGRV